MPQMPKDIVKGGKEALSLKNNDLFVQKGYINGAWVDADNKSTFPVHNKATQTEIGSVPNMGKAETKKAIDSANEAYKEWSQTTGKHRQDLLTKLFNALQENTEDLAKIITVENGKPLAESKGELAYSNGFIEWFAAEATRTYGKTIPAPLPNVRNVTIRQPVGVCALITPWNFPAAMITRKLAPALAAGCTAVIKAPAETPYTSLAITKLAEQVGFPKGVINVITCAKGENEAAVGKELCENSIVRKLSFTGSTRVGKLLMNQCSNSLKKLSFELGGNAPFIVFGDADLDKAVEGALACKFRGAGQTCICANRIFVHDSVYDEFASKLAARVDKFKVGNGLEEGIQLGPLVNEAGRDKVADHVKRSKEAGAEVLVGGKAGEGLFYEPTVLANIPEHAPMDDEETFGPLAALYRFKTEEEVLAKVNASPVGLAGYFYSGDVARCFRVAERLEVGMVGINAAIISQNVVPFGGIKESGFGREGGPGGIDEYMVDKLMVFGV
ncbi:aldehyde dehydrogenase [Meira miltonrushii]|uniref:succinate-semialdehyde dehydrogenase [NAD(P)(+)] n=1 Tax=Meira miltonrushii TaxID=1280837 RepID=A0A316VL95_9BASI|nr:aldehyde dehydrogenase [Meira miltonrushii]PWN38372.1 aldehyde dehydrogenase [Meira miltonrushii]